MWSPDLSETVGGYGAGGNISTSDHPCLPNKSHDTAVTLYVIGSFLGNSMICFENSHLTPFMTPLAGFMDL